MAPGAAIDPVPYFAASGLSAFLTFPLWKAAAIGQSGFQLQGQSALARYWEAVRPPWKGSMVVVGGMTWARAAIFFGSDESGRLMREAGFSNALSSTLPALTISCFVQATNQPFVRSSIMLQDPQCSFAKESRTPNLAVMQHLVKTKGLGSLWLGTNAGILKTAPKYMMAIVIKDWMESTLAPVDKKDKTGTLLRSAKKSVAAGVAGAVLTNPLDVVRNEMFKTEEGLVTAHNRLWREEGAKWLVRGCAKNLVAVAAPIALTIFTTDMIADKMKKA